MLLHFRTHSVPTCPPSQKVQFFAPPLLQQSLSCNFNLLSFPSKYFCGTGTNYYQKFFVFQEMKHCIYRSSLSHTANIWQGLFQWTTRCLVIYHVVNDLHRLSSVVKITRHRSPCVSTFTLGFSPSCAKREEGRKWCLELGSMTGGNGVILGPPDLNAQK